MSPAMTNTTKTSKVMQTPNKAVSQSMQTPNKAVSQSMQTPQSQNHQNSTLVHYSLMTSLDASKRLESAQQLLTLLARFQGDVHNKIQQLPFDLDTACAPDVAYGLRRLLRGLPSSRDAARQGFAVALTELLSSLEMLDISFVVETLHTLTEANGTRSGQEEKELHLGRLFGYMAICKSGMLTRSSTTMENVLEMTSALLQCISSKSYLAEAAYQVLISMLKEIQTTPIAKAASDAMIRLVLSDGIKSAEDLWFIIEAQHCVQSFTSWSDVMGDWKHTKVVLHHKNKNSIVEILKNTTESESRVHSAWTAVIDRLVSDEASLTSKQLSIGELWSSLEETLFTTTHGRKYVGFQVFQIILQAASEKQIPLLFTPNFLRCLINNLSNKDNYLHKQAQQTAVLLSTVANEKPLTALPLMLQLLGKNGNLRFDSVTKTKTVENLLLALNTDQIESYLDFLASTFSDPASAMHSNSEELADPVRIDGLRRWILEQMAQLVRMGKICKEQSWLSLIAEFMVVHGFFRSTGKETKSKTTQMPESDISEETQQFCREKLISILNALSNISLTDSSNTEADPSTVRISKASLGKRLNGDTWIYYICELIRTLESNKHLTSIGRDALDEDAIEAISASYTLVETIRQRKTATPATDVQVLTELGGLELLQLHVLLNIYYEPEESTLLVKEIQDCYSRLYPIVVEPTKTASSKTKKRKAAEDTVKATIAESDSSELTPEPIEVLVDILIGFLAKPSVLLRSLSSDVFTVFCNRMTPKALSLIFDVLSAKGGVQGASELFETEDVDMDSVDEDDQDQSSSDSDDGDDEDENNDDDDNNAPVDEELRRKITETLGKAAVTTSDNSDDSDNEGMDDDEMQAFDDKLAEIFRQRKDIKQTKRDTKQSVMHFKLRVMDLLEVLVRVLPTSPLMVALCQSLTAIAYDTHGSHDERDLHSRAISIASNRVCKTKATPVVHTSEAIDALKEVHVRMASAPDVKFSKFCSAMSIYLVKVVHNSVADLDDSAAVDTCVASTTETVSSSQSRKRVKGSAKGDTKENMKPASSVASIQGVEAVCQVYISSFTDMITKKGTHVHPQAFHDLIARFPTTYASAVVVHMCTVLAAAEKTKTFPLIQSIGIIAMAIKQMRDIDAWMKEVSLEVGYGGRRTVFGFCGVIVATLENATAAPAEGPFAFSKDRVREVLRSVIAVLRRVKKSLGDVEFQTVCITERLSLAAQALSVTAQFKDVKSVMQAVTELRTICSCAQAGAVKEE
ncbi:hypothetical protein BASA83_010212 [Batrachochytrium salamandrivorans]|nr:hypothetical protein BASA62_001663 [Batrachochytrium salamandrivorans]KAH9267014.1 hypothetical protein BASA83_010212 [Batrachochytrium salamandrivorans]